MRAMTRDAEAFVGPHATLSEAKAALAAIEGCQDVFVTDDGGRSGKVLGWLTNGMLAKLSSAGQRWASARSARHRSGPRTGPRPAIAADRGTLRRSPSSPQAAGWRRVRSCSLRERGPAGLHRVGNPRPSPSCWSG
jgi:hypothetical protein